VKLIRLDEGDEIAAITKLDDEDTGAVSFPAAQTTNPPENSSEDSNPTQ